MDAAGDTLRSQLTPLAHVLRSRWADEDYGGAKALVNVVWGGGRNEDESTVQFVTDPTTVPEVPGIIEKYIGHKGRALTGVECDDQLSSFPLELKLMVLDFLDYSDVPSALTALRWNVPAHFWRNRFRSNLFFEINDFPTQDVNWYYLWLASERLLHNKPPPGLVNRCRILRILKAVLHDLNSYQRLYSVRELSTDLNQWSVVYRSPRANVFINSAQATCVPANVEKLLFSFATIGTSAQRFLSGIKFLPHGLSLGYCLPDDTLPEWAIFSVPSSFTGLMVKLDERGVRDIKPICSGSKSHWIVGFGKEDASVGILFDDNDTAGVEVRALLDVSSI